MTTRRISDTEFPERTDLDEVEDLLKDLLGLGQKWVNTKFEWLAGDCIYKGENEDLAALDGDLDWTITRFDWTAGECTQKRIRTTSWTLRAVGW